MDTKLDMEMKVRKEQKSRPHLNDYSFSMPKCNNTIGCISSSS